ncbi:MAG: glycosyltransferase family 4 protein [Dongiaceae bacterium]
MAKAQQTELQTPEPAPANAAIMYAVDGFDTSRDKLMGRHVAGEEFLKGYARYADVDTFYGLMIGAQNTQRFQQDLSRWTGGRAKVEIISYNQLARVAEPGTLFLPGPGLGEWAWRRRVGDQRSYSITGVTHTTASPGAMDSIVGLLIAPVQPWDALICTSTAVRKTIERVLDEQEYYLRKRLGARRFPRPELPVIPLGVDCSAFERKDKTRYEWRRKLKIGKNDVVFLFVGRLSFHAKAHPHPMYLAAEAAAKKSGKKIHLIQSGWFANDFIEAAFKDAAKALCPSVTCHFLDGREPATRTEIWSAADAFVSLSDNIQETFGLTPIEAMAAGLPVVVTDWDGYMDTVRHGKDGFRIPTLQPPPGTGEDLAFRMELGIDTYDRYCGNACQFVAVDTAACADAFTQLANSPELREKMGASGAKHARTTYDWRVVVGQYQALWQSLAEIRTSAPESASHTTDRHVAVPHRMDPFDTFQHYATDTLGPDHRISLVEGADAKLLLDYRNLPTSNYAAAIQPDQRFCSSILDFIGKRGTATVAQMSKAVSADKQTLLMRALVWMNKLDIVTIKPPQRG